MGRRDIEVVEVPSHYWDKSSHWDTQLPRPFTDETKFLPSWPRNEVAKQKVPKYLNIKYILIEEAKEKTKQKQTLSDRDSESDLTFPHKYGVTSDLEDRVH